MPALAVAGEVAQTPGLRVVLVGAERGVERTILPTRPYPFHLLPAEPIYRRQWWKNARWPWLALRLMRKIDRMLAEERPSLVLGTGGYVSGPVLWRAAAHGIPTAIQEQNAYPGLATRWLARRVRHIYLGVPEAVKFLRPGPQTEVFELGNPITPPDPALTARARVRFGITGDRPVLLVTGGSQGSLAVNEFVANWIRSGGARGVQCIWAAGRTTYEQFRSWHAPPNVQVYDFIDPMAEAYSVADLVVARAGMMTIAELCAWRLPSVLIPLPSAAADHQTPNARVMADAGAAIHLPQNSLTEEAFGRTLSELLGDPVRRAQMGARAESRAHPDAAAEIWRHLRTLAA